MLLQALSYVNRRRQPSRPALLDSNLRNNLEYATSTLLVEFQEAQCFFIMAIAIAQLYSNSQNAVFNDIHNWASLEYQQTSIRASMRAGMLSVALTQSLLFHVQLSSVYTLFAASVAVILVNIAIGTTMSLDYNTALDMFKAVSSFEECGGYPSLRQLCLGKLDTDRTDGGEFWITFDVVLVCISLAILWLEKFYTLLPDSKVAKKCRWVGNISSSTVVPVANMIIKILVTTIEMLLGFTLFVLIVLGRSAWSSLGASIDSNISSPGWSVGQVISVFLWAPMLFKYIYVAGCKSRHLLSSHWHDHG